MLNRALSLFSNFQIFFQGQLFRKLVGLFFLAVIAWQLGELLSLQLRSPQVPSFPVLNKMQMVEMGPKLQGMPSYLFGKALIEPSQNAAESLKVDALEPTRLRMKLLGTIVVDKRAVAIIESAGTTLVVGEGEPVIKDVDLIKVFADEVIIEYRGRREKLQMEQAGEGLISAIENVVESPSELSVEQKAILKEIGQTLREQPLSISKYIRFQPVNQNGKLSGVKIWPHEQKEVFDALGLEPGDVLKSVNGQSIEEIGQDAAGWQSFLEQTQLELQLERNGQELSLSISLN